MLYRLEQLLGSSVEASEVDWSTRVVRVNVKRQTLRNAPEYGPTSDLSRIPDEGVW